MSTVRQTSGPVPLAAAVERVIDRSDERGAQLRLRLAAWREGWLAGHGNGYEQGRRDALDEETAQRREAAGLAAEAMELQRERWRLRGQRRDRATFSRPHPGDYPGKSGAA